jgi:hypothetical protein
LEKVAETERGRQLLECAAQNGVIIGCDTNNVGGYANSGINGIFLDPVNPEGIGSQHPIRLEEHEDELPSNCKDDPTNPNDGGPDDPCRNQKDMADVLAHELGHLVGGSDCDTAADEKDGGDNVCRNENPVRDGLGLCRRTKDHGVAMDCGD